jgi:hydrogenase maturation protease
MAIDVVVKQCLVIGCGNTLRGDDGLGPYIAETLQNMTDLYGVDVRIVAVPQLDVILASRMREADVVIFVDARGDASEELVKIERVEPAAGPVALQHTSHTISMPVLLRIALDWYGAAPLCYAVMPKGYDFSVGELVSEKAQTAAAHARNKIIEIIKSLRDSI